jgi:hypothetical protein
MNPGASRLYIKRINVAKNIQAIRGMNDYLPGETALWQRIEATFILFIYTKMNPGASRPQVQSYTGSVSLPNTLFCLIRAKASMLDEARRIDVQQLEAK